MLGIAVGFDGTIYFVQRYEKSDAKKHTCLLFLPIRSIFDLRRNGLNRGSFRAVGELKEVILVVRFFADRYHTSAENVVRCFLIQNGICPEQGNEPMTFRLEDNEMDIMRGLTFGSNS